MEIRIWLPENWAALRYMIKHPRSFVIGVYGEKRWQETHRQYLAERSKVLALEDQMRLKNQKLKTLGKELSAYKRGDVKEASLRAEISTLKAELQEARNLDLD